MPKITRNEEDASPQLQTKRDILDDPTLRAGDALMTKNGVRIYVGSQSSRHNIGEFVPLASAGRLNAEKRDALSALNTFTRAAKVARREGPFVESHVELHAVAGQANATVRYIGP